MFTYINGTFLKNLFNKNCIEISSKRFYAVRKRFFKKAGVLYNEGKYEIILDQRKLKTPKGNLFTVESKPLALAIVAEWNRQKDKIQQNTMHLTTICNTAIDNPNNLNKYDLVQYITNYLDTDTVLFQSHENDDLYKLQIKEWDPIIQWFCDKFKVSLPKSRNMTASSISVDTKAIITRHLMSYDLSSIHGFVYGVDTLKSTILTLACTERSISPEKASLLSRLEEEFQAQKWGRVEWAHDLSQQDLQARVAATVLFIYFNSSTWLIKRKHVK